MNLRPDITEAAARLTSGFDVSRELRQLGAHLREGEAVHRLAAGVYGSGGGLLAVTNRRVLLLRDGRSGQASEGFPLERITSVRWVGGSVRGAIVIHDAHSAAELTQVEPSEGTSVVGFIRSLLPTEPHEEHGSYVDADAHDDLDDRNGLLTHSGLALATAGVGAANGMARPVNGVNGSAAATATRSGRFAVPMTVRTPREAPVDEPGSIDRLPEQKTAATGRAAHNRSRTDLPETDVADLPYGHDPYSGRAGEPDPYTGRDRYAGPDQINGRTRFADQVDGRTQFTERDDLPGRGRYADHDYADRDFADRDLADRDHADRDHADRDLGDRYPGADEFAGRDQRFGRDDHPGRDQESGSHDTVNGRASASVPGLRGVERSGPLVGEVPVSRLAEETGGHRAASVSSSGGVERDRIRSRAELNDETGRIPAGLAGTRRGDTGPDGPGSAGRFDKLRGADMSRNKKLMVGGAAAVLALAVVGGVVAVSKSGSEVTPAPVAADAAGTVTVSKVIDGDSIEVEGPAKEQVEIIGIVAPRTDKEQCGAADSSGFATRTLGGSKITLISDPSQPATDRSGRKLASVRTDNGLDYAVLAAQAGMARYYEGGTPVAQAAEIKAGQAEAEKAGRGLWGSPCNGKTSTAKTSTSAAGSSSSSAAGSSSSSTTRSSSNSGSSNSGSSNGTGTNSGSSNGSGTNSLTGSGLDSTASNSSRFDSVDSFDGLDTGN